jgi:hypothetical protein
MIRLYQEVIQEHSFCACFVKQLCCLLEERIDQKFKVMLEWDDSFVLVLFPELFFFK